LALRRYLRFARYGHAIRVFDALFKSNPGLLEPRDIIEAARALESQGDLERAASIARHLIESHRVWTPGAHLLLAKHAASEKDDRRAYDESFLEYFGIGEFGPFHDEAQQFWLKVLQTGDGPVFDALRAFFSFSMPVEVGRFYFFKESRKRLHRLSAVAAIDHAISLWGKPSLALTQLRLETLLELALQDIVELTAIEQELTRLVKEEGSKFAPAYLQLARAAHHRGHIQEAEAMWRKARSLAPMSEQVMSFEHFLTPPKVPMFGTRVTTGLLRWCERMSISAGKERVVAKALLLPVRILSAGWLSVINPVRHFLWRLRNRAALRGLEDAVRGKGMNDVLSGSAIRRDMPANKQVDTNLDPAAELMQSVNSTTISPSYLRSRSQAGPL
jgi:tetratricopeptide (TPR) repeat protein